MTTPHDRWQVERMQPPEMPPCRNCKHPESFHAPAFCCSPDCLCDFYEPMDAEELRQDEHSEEI